MHTRRTPPVSVLFGFCIVLLQACSLASRTGEFSATLGAKLRTERPSEVDLSTIGSERWEELFAFGPYTRREENCQILQLGWLECRMTFPSTVDEREYILVFREDRKIVHSEHHPRLNGDFAPHPSPVKRSAATFSVRSITSSPPQSLQWFRLEHKG
jgi:hypothetical protein